MTTNASTTARLAMITLDCADPGPVSSFWRDLLGWELTYGDDNYAMLQGPSHSLGFGRVEDYEPPAWPNPNGTKQFHFDLAVDDIPAAERASRRARGFSARRAAWRRTAGGCSSTRPATRSV